MTVDIVALCRGEPDLRGAVDALVAAEPELHADAVAGGALLQLYDDEGEPLLAVEGPVLVQVPGEVERLLGVPGVDCPVWWVEARATSDRPEAAEIARRLADALVARLGGVVWPA